MKGRVMMAVEERVRYLLRAACRAEDEGDKKVARSLRCMAKDALCPVTPRLAVAE